MPQKPIPKIKPLRDNFLLGLTRFCFLLALAHLLSLIPLRTLSVVDPENQNFSDYTILATALGSLFLVIGIVSRRTHLRTHLSGAIFLVLLAEIGILRFSNREFSHPSSVYFILLCFFITPLRGKRSAYYIAAFGAALNFSHYFNIVTGHLDFTSPNFLNLLQQTFALFLAAFISEWLWNAITQREQQLEHALSEVEKRASEMDRWVGQLAEVTSASSSAQISTANESAQIPHEKLQELSKNIGEMQTKLGNILGSLLIQERLSSLSTLASGLAHEINTPLTTIEFLIESHTGKIPVALEQQLRGEISRITGITREFLSYSTVECEPQVHLLNAILRDLLPILRRLSQNRVDITLTDNAPDTFIRAQKNHIQQVIVNLTRNALDALVGTKMPVVAISLNRLGAQAEISIQDNGMGIAPDILPKVFNPFFTTKRSDRGTGLGLYLVQEIVKNHNGNISVTSTLQKGTTFKIGFPLIDKFQSEAA